jgi:hypothetical protein
LIYKPLKYTNAFISCEHCRVVDNVRGNMQGGKCYLLQTLGHFHPLETDVSTRNDSLSLVLDLTILL